MDDEEKKDEEIGLTDSALDDVLGGEETEDEEGLEDPLAAIDEFGGGGDFNEKQWE